VYITIHSNQDSTTIAAADFDLQFHMKSIEPPYFFVGSAGFYIVGILLVALVLYAIKRWIIHARSQQADG
jgi:hypothetical protein